MPDLGSQIPALARSASYRAAARRIGGALVRSAPYRAAAQRIGGAQAKRALGSLDAFDLVCIIQIENYFRLQHGLKSDGRTIVRLTSNRFQVRVQTFMTTVSPTAVTGSSSATRHKRSNWAI